MIFFENQQVSYHVSAFFFRVEFQQRGSPHVHSVIWLKDRDKMEAPSYYVNNDSPEDGDTGARVKKIEEMADLLVSTNPCYICCKDHMHTGDSFDCLECKTLKNKVEKYQTHHHTTTCAKKGKLSTLRKMKVLADLMELYLVKNSLILLFVVLHFHVFPLMRQNLQQVCLRIQMRKLSKTGKKC